VQKAALFEVSVLSRGSLLGREAARVRDGKSENGSDYKQVLRLCMRKRKEEGKFAERERRSRHEEV
jgi:hypothetical protein